ncbi:CHASE domain-containing protein [Pokkaliibacter sp. CJK22405]|uniref:CHASE domain-containing sensor histidine kinase n=1 Tax=Pokkaliibacter sp. CJK22405 TaxID=3384615 RepID=UPI00398540E3
MEYQRSSLPALHFSRSSRLHWWHWLVVGLSLAITFIAWLITSEQAQEKSKAKFAAESAQLLELVQERMAMYEEALWSGVAALHVMAAPATRQQWRTFAASLEIERRYPGVNGMGVIHHVPPTQLPEYLRWQREQLPDFDIHPEHTTPDHWTISYIEPEPGNRQAVGLDMAHERNRYEAVQKARDTGKATITGPIILVQDAKKTPGFLLFVPWYRDIQVPTSLEDRRQSIIGLAYAPFVMASLMDGTLAKTRRYIHFSIRDGEVPLYSELNDETPGFDAQPLFRKEQNVAMYGRPWQFTFQSSALFRQENTTQQPLFILIGGLLIDAILLSFFIMLGRSSTRAHAYADKATEHIRQQQTLLERTHQRLNSAMNAMIDGLVVIDTQGIIRDSNSTTYEIFGYPPGSLIGKNISVLMSPDSASVHDMFLQRARDHSNNELAAIGKHRALTALRADGREIPIKVCITRGDTEEGQFFTGIIHDLSALTDTRQRNEELSNIMQAAVHAAGAGFLLLSPDNRILQANEALLDWLGFSLEEAPLKQLEDIIVSRAELLLLQERLRQEIVQALSCNLVFFSADGSPRWGYATLAKVHDQRGQITYWVLQVIDIDEEVRLARDLAQRNTELEEANKELDQFAFVASHDLKAPLRGIQQLLEWIEEEHPAQQSNEVKEYFALAFSRIGRLQRLLDDLLDYSRVGRKADSFKTIHLRTTVEEEFRVLGAGQHVTLHNGVTLGEITTLAAPLELILRNLMSNAIKHHDQPTGNIWVRGWAEEDSYHFAVEDDGPGIAPEHQQQVFGLFNTLKPRDEVEGSGIGLTVIKKILDRYECQYLLESDGVRGTCFHFTWPAEEVLRRSSHAS